jgi:L-ascorbate metabolism protein UlaG (beta-lactamase superfamily)
MSNVSVYLRQDAVIEPLIHQWYAWPYLLSPATAAMYLKNSQLPIMESFVATPQVHVAALKNPAMRGGPYLELEATRVPEVSALLKRTLTERSRLIELANAIKALDGVLLEEAKGFSLEPLYRKVPEALRGLVELAYDVNHHPVVRYFEGLLYRSEYYDPGAQSLSLSLNRGVRPFSFSTPRFSGPEEVHVSVPFASPGLDTLYGMRFQPQPLGALGEALGLGADELGRLAPFFTEQPPPPLPSGDDFQGVRIRYLGHACLLIQSRDVSILTDPILSHGGGDLPDHFTYADLPARIDYVVLTHNHQDHCVFETLLELRHRVKTVVVPKSGGGGIPDMSLKLALKHLGFQDVVELDELETCPLPDGELLALPFLGEHADLNIRTKAGFFLSLKGHSLMLLADSNNLEPRLYERLHRIIGDAELLFIGMECDGAPLSWLYGPLLTRKLARGMDQSRRFDGSDSEKASAIVRQFQPKQVYVYAMGQEPWMYKFMVMNYSAESRPLLESNKFLASCRDQGRIAERPYCKKEILLP